MTEMHPTEADTKRIVKKLLKQYGWWHWMPVASHGFGTNGASDHHALRKGVFLAIEAKHKKTVGSPQQQEFGKNVSDNGGYHRVVNLAQVKDGSFEQWLSELTRLVDNRT